MKSKHDVTNKLLKQLSHIFGAEHAFGSPQNGVLAGIVGMIFGGDFQNCWNWSYVLVDRVPDHFCDLQNKHFSIEFNFNGINAAIVSTQLI